MRQPSQLLPGSREKPVILASGVGIEARLSASEPSVPPLPNLQATEDAPITDIGSNVHVVSSVQVAPLPDVGEGPNQRAHRPGPADPDRRTARKRQPIHPGTFGSATGFDDVGMQAATSLQSAGYRCATPSECAGLRYPVAAFSRACRRQ